MRLILTRPAREREATLGPVRRFIVIGLALALVVGLLVAGVVVWRRLDRSHVEQALHAVPAGAKRIGFTDWGVVRREVDARLGDDPSSGRIDDFVAKAYDRDFTAASSVDSAAVAHAEDVRLRPGERAVGGVRPGQAGRSHGA